MQEMPCLGQWRSAVQKLLGVLGLSVWVGCSASPVPPSEEPSLKITPAGTRAAATPTIGQQADSAVGAGPPPSVPTQVRATLAIHDHGGCVVDRAGTLQCWGFPSTPPPPEVRFVELSTTCALDTEGYAWCRSREGWVKTALPKATNLFRSCVTPVTGGMQCVDFSRGYPLINVMRKDGEFLDLSGAWLLQRDGALYPAGGSGSPLPGQKVVAITDYCALRADGSVRCAGYDLRQQLEALGPVKFKRIYSASDKSGCGQLTTGKYLCWGKAAGLSFPNEDFAELAFADSVVCGLVARTGRVKCWGHPDAQGAHPPPAVGEYLAAFTPATGGSAFPVPLPAPTPSPRAANAGPAAPQSATGTCIKQIDWKNRGYPVSPIAPKPFELSKGEHRLTVKKVKPDPLMTLGMSEQGTMLFFRGVVEAELDGQAPSEAVVDIALGDFGLWHGNRPSSDPHSVRYVFRVDSACTATSAGVVDVPPGGFVRFEGGALVHLQPKDEGALRKEWHLEGASMNLVKSGLISDAELNGPPKLCDEQKFLAALPKQAGKLPWDFRDPCLEQRLSARLGKREKDFAANSSGPSTRMQIEDGYLIATFCRAGVCGGYHAAYAVNVRSGEVSAAIESGGRAEFFSAGAPPEPLKRVVSEFQAQSRDLSE